VEPITPKGLHSIAGTEPEGDYLSCFKV